MQNPDLVYPACAIPQPDDPYITWKLRLLWAQMLLVSGHRRKAAEVAKIALECTAETVDAYAVSLLAVILCHTKKSDAAREQGCRIVEMITSWKSRTGSNRSVHESVIANCATLASIMPLGKEALSRHVWDEAIYEFGGEPAFPASPDPFVGVINNATIKNLTKSQSCSCCGRQEVKLLKCAKCKQAAYCNTECQNLDWQKHRHFCSISAGGPSSTSADAGASASSATIVTEGQPSVPPKLSKKAKQKARQLAKHQE